MLRNVDERTAIQQRSHFTFVVFVTQHFYVISPTLSIRHTSRVTQ